jgi:hypothetical protein
MTQHANFRAGAAQAANEFAAKPIQDLFKHRYADLWNAARLLGGYEASRIVDKCATRLEAEGLSGNQVWIMLDQIRSLLELEETHDPEKPYLGFFALIDPADPVVEEICVLTDALADAIAEAKKRKSWAERRGPVPSAA